jgi:hypothetical protein
LLPLNNFETMYGRSIATNVSKDEDDLWREFIPKKFIYLFDDYIIE